MGFDDTYILPNTKVAGLVLHSGVSVLLFFVRLLTSDAQDDFSNSMASICLPECRLKLFHRPYAINERRHLALSVELVDGSKLRSVGFLNEELRFSRSHNSSVQIGGSLVVWRFLDADDSSVGS